MALQLWDHQQAALTKTLDSISSGRRTGLWVLPTGTGKTRTFVALAGQMAVPTLVVVHREELLRQAVETFNALLPGVAVGTLPGDGWQDARIVVATVQSLHRKLDRFPPERFGLVVIDEAHHAVAGMWAKLIDYFRPQFLLGCTATPERLDGRPLEVWFGQPLYTYGLRQAIEDGYLVPIRQRSVQTDVDLDTIRASSTGDLNKKDLARAVMTRARTEAVVQAFLNHAADLPTLVFAVSLEHAEQLRHAFERAGVRAAAVTGEMKTEYRREVLEDFRRGEYRVLISYEVLTEGYDERSVSCIIMARPTKSRVLYQQCVGRGLRIFPEGGKRDCLVIDIRDRCTRHRLVTVSQLFGADVQDCRGMDVIEAVEAEKRRWALEPLSLSPNLAAKWALGEETAWPRVPDLRGYRPQGWWANHPATERQIKKLTKTYGMVILRPLTSGEASYLIDGCKRTDREYPTPATPGQRFFLWKEGLWRDGMSKREAQSLIAQSKMGVI
jgi:superfamily II DNA or RNA helicase